MPSFDKHQRSAAPVPVGPSLFDREPVWFGLDAMLEGSQWIFRIGNVGVSVIQNKISHGHDDGLFEIAFTEWYSDDPDDWALIRSLGVVGYLTRENVMSILGAFGHVQRK